MKVEIALWEIHKMVHIAEGDSNALIVTKFADHTTLVKLPGQPGVYLDSAETKTMIKALELAAKVTRYLDELPPGDAYDMIAGLPTTPYDGWRPMPRAGRTEN